MTRAAIALSKVFLVLVALAGVFVQVVLLPIQAAESAAEFPEVEFLRIPILVLGILFVACGQVVVVCVWALLSLVRRDAIFSTRAFKYVDTMIASLALATAIVVAILLILQLTADAGPPGLVVLALGVATACAALALVLIVMRRLLAKASEQAQYLDEVV
ncbi:DUF2975 domain-containing protein [Homoserinimonas hongtaonis]|uniref:DUF2975 domain-containing protein n=1 Tax=Homoserinimonas hongtaonis TaxID=2079791 RepID=A0A2U1T020_9MICO|nr:DUF2975 domain-containing protein [Salinibacterium hongtaonis]AWB89744.1 DUF2975 domain-containing protein [Salinibacterium hongtaonis]PWB97198.1 DUF2975 domain-containing protein [Salinibacterium hongtaonis]